MATLLEKEAEYQNSKVGANVRKNQAIFYKDKSFKLIDSRRAEIIGDMSGKYVLDIGCGFGYATINALKTGARVCSIDISDKSLKQLEEKLAEEGLSENHTSFVMDAQNMTFEDDTFDIVMGNGILHHLPELEKSVEGVIRVLKPGGKAVFLEPLGMNPFINFYRRFTPKARTPDEQPLLKDNLMFLIGKGAKLEFYDNLTLIVKALNAAHLKSFSEKIEDKIISADQKWLRKEGHPISFQQKMAWTVIILIEKPLK